MTGVIEGRAFVHKRDSLKTAVAALKVPPVDLCSIFTRELAAEMAMNWSAREDIVFVLCRLICGAA